MPSKIQKPTYTPNWHIEQFHIENIKSLAVNILYIKGLIWQHTFSRSIYAFRHLSKPLFVLTDVRVFLKQESSNYRYSDHLK